MSNRAVFRLAVIGLLVFELAIGASLYFFFDYEALEPALELLPESANWYSYLDNDFLPLIIAILLVIVVIASVIGVLLFKNWGRWLYISSTLLALPVYCFTGPDIYYGWESALWEVASMANGALMLAMFLPPISHEFNR